MGSLRAHWGRLIAVAGAVVAGGFALPLLAPPPDLEENRTLAGAPSLRDPTDIAAFRHAADASQHGCARQRPERRGRGSPRGRGVRDRG